MSQGKIADAEKNKHMIEEYAGYQMADGRQHALERAYEHVQSMLVSSPHCLSKEL
jgi:hypothetical protein